MIFVLLFLAGSVGLHGVNYLLNFVYKRRIIIVCVLACTCEWFYCFRI